MIVDESSFVGITAVSLVEVNTAVGSDVLEGIGVALDAGKNICWICGTTSQAAIHAKTPTINANTVNPMLIRSLFFIVKFLN